jgi:GNAT superfamily N-acetyltransferase
VSRLSRRNNAKISRAMRIERIDARDPELRPLLSAYFADLQHVFGTDVAEPEPPTDPADYTPPHGVFLVVRDAETGDAVGCGAVRMLDAGTAEVKRMWLDARCRGRGAGRALLTALEDEARAMGATRGVLDTHASLASALALYRSSGWDEVPPYNDNPDATHWFAKSLTEEGS